MSSSASKSLWPFDSSSPQISISQLQTPASDEIAEADKQSDIEPDDSQAAMKEINPQKPSARTRLEKCLGFRIQPSAISLPPPGTFKRGGKAEVVQATFQRKIWNKRKQVAVKKLWYHKDMDNHRFANEFVNEVELMARLSHENIIKLIGFVEEFEIGRGWIVMSWAPNGNVSEFLATGRWEIPERISLIQDTFEGLRYLHTRQPPICHGDLKSLNILVSALYRAIITDFGSARVLRESADIDKDKGKGTGQGTNDHSTPREDSPQIHALATGNQLTLTGPAWSLRWAPPEVVNGSHPGLPSDVWSAGWVMTDKLPFPELHSGTAITMRVIQGKVPSASEDEQLSQIVRLCNLMTECWALDPKDRPTVSRCSDEVRWVPSLVPLGGVSAQSKVQTSRLLLQMGRMQFLHARYQDAAPLFQKALDVATPEKDEIERAEALHWLGNVSAALSQYTEAKESYRRAYNMYDRIGDDLGRANTLQGLGVIYHRQSQFAEAGESFTRAQHIYNTLHDDQGRASTLCGLGHLYRTQSAYGNAEESFAKAQEIYACIGDGHGQANALLGLGSVYHIQSKFAEADEAFNRANSIYARIGDDVGRANASVGLGDVYCAQSKYGLAELLYTRALDINSRVGNVQGQANAMYGLGEVHLHQSEYTKAESSYTKALDIFTHIGNGGGQASVLHGLGEVYHRQYKYTEAVSNYIHAGDIYRCQSQYTEAESSYTKARDVYAVTGNSRGQANALYMLGEVYRHLSKHTQAASSYTQAREIYCSIHDDEGQANVLHGLGELYLHQSKYTQAESLYIDAYQIFAGIRNGGGQANALRGLGDVSHRQSKSADAVSYYTRAGNIYRRRKQDTEAQSLYNKAREIYARIGNGGD